MMPALDISLREELLVLRKKVVMLETADSDNDRLRKEVTKLQEEKSKSELDFMNQLSDVIRENAMKIDEVTGQLQESNNVNRALSDQLKSRDHSPEEMEKKIEDLEYQYKNQISQLMSESNHHFSEVGRMRTELHDAKISRDELLKKLEKSTKPLNDLEHPTYNVTNSTLKVKPEVPTACQTQNDEEVTRLEDENRALKNTIALLQNDNNEAKIALDDYRRRRRSDLDGTEEDTDIYRLEKDLKTSRDSVTQMENGSRDPKNSSHNESSIEQSRENDRSPSLSNTYSHGKAGMNENRTSKIIEQLEQNLKNDRQKKESSFKEIKTQTINDKSSRNEKSETERIISDEQKNEMEGYKFRILKLETEALSTKDLLASERDIFRKQTEDLKSKLEELNDTLNNSENSRAALAFDKEQLLAEKDRVAERKIQLEQKAKNQHQRLKQLQKVVDEKLNNVENTRRSDEIQIECLRDQVKSLKRGLLCSQDQVYHLNKTPDDKEGIESTDKDISIKNTKSLHAQMNKPRKELTKKPMEFSEAERRYKKEINELENALESVHLEQGASIKARDIAIEKLKGAFEEKNNASQRLEKEKEQLVLSIQDMMKNRREEVDDLQNEILAMNTSLANEKREISTLKSRLEYKTTGMNHLRERVTELSRQLALKKDVKRDHKFEVEKLRRKLKKMSEKLSENSAYDMRNDAGRMAI